MSQLASNTYGLNDTGASGELEHLLGQIGYFDDLNYSASGVKTSYSSAIIVARWVKNESGGALTPGTVVTWDTGSTYGPLKAAGVAAVSGTSIGVGVVSPWIATAGVSNDDHFWLIHQGPCKFKFTTGTALGIGDAVSLGAAGRVVDLDHTGLSDQLIFDRCGTALAAVAAGVASDTLFRAHAQFLL